MTEKTFRKSDTNGLASEVNHMFVNLLAIYGSYARILTRKVKGLGLDLTDQNISYPFADKIKKRNCVGKLSPTRLDNLNCAYEKTADIFAELVRLTTIPFAEADFEARGYTVDDLVRQARRTAHYAAHEFRRTGVETCGGQPTDYQTILHALCKETGLPMPAPN